MHPVKMMTKEGYHRLADEFNQLRNEERPKVVQGVADAAAEGDRSENAEYIYGKKRLREIDKRLRYLGSLLKDVKVIDPSTLSGDQVCFGANATVCDLATNQEKVFTLVGEGESDAQQGRIAMISPVGKALFGKKVGDVVVIDVPGGEVEYEIMAITFG